MRVPRPCSTVHPLRNFWLQPLSDYALKRVKVLQVLNHGKLTRELAPKSEVSQTSSRNESDYPLKRVMALHVRSKQASYIQIGDAERVFLDKFAARLDDIAHHFDENI